MGKTIPAGAAATLDLDRCALFLDYDGTLVDLAPTPAEALADAELRELLAALQVRLAGALAIVTGRPVADIDGFLAPLRLTVAGLHGLVRRRHDGRLTETAPAARPHGTGADGAGRLRGRPSRNHGRGQAFERGPALPTGARGGEAASELAQQLAEGSGGHLRLQRGKMVVELLPAGSDKGRAIAALLDEPEFRGRTPGVRRRRRDRRGRAFAASTPWAASASGWATGRPRPASSS